MTLQERMIQAYLKEANMPPEEKGKLKLFLVLLDETYQEDRTGQDRTGQDRTGQDTRAGDAGNYL